MRIVLICQEVRRLGDRKYLIKFRQFPNGQEIIEVEAELPAVPGAAYNVMLRGLWPDTKPSEHLHNCVVDLLSFTCRETLSFVSLQRQAEAGVYTG